MKHADRRCSTLLVALTGEIDRGNRPPIASDSFHMLKHLSIIVFAFVAALPASAQMPPATVTTQPVERRAANFSQSLVATVEPVTRTTLAAEEPGFVAAREFDEGQRVEKGATLASTRTDLLAKQVAAAKAQQASAAAMVDRAKAEAKNAGDELDRLRKMEQGASVKEQQDAVAAARVTAAMVGVREAELAEKGAEAERLQLMLDKATIRSPIGGVVQRRHIEVGQWLKQGDPIADIVQLDPLFVRVNVPEEVIATIKKGDKALVAFDALRSKPIQATVDQILPEADPASRSFTVKLLVPNEKFEVRPGFFARVVFQRSSASDGVLVPRDALVSHGEKAHVVAVRQGKAAIVPVTRGPAEGDKVIVYGELEDGEAVVTRGNESLQPGQPLIIKPSPPAGAPATAPAKGAATRPGPQAEAR